MLDGSFMRCGGTVQILPSKSISFHFMPRTSFDRAAVKTMNLSTSALMPSCFASRTMNWGAARQSSGVMRSRAFGLRLQVDEDRTRRRIVA